MNTVSLFVYPRRPLYLSRRSMKRTGLKLARCWKSVEAGTSRALHLKVAARIAAGWIRDGNPVRVTRYAGARSRSRFAQLMFMRFAPAA